MPEARSQPPLRSLVVMGVSGSGKSTIGEALARRLDWRFEDGDAFHPPANIAKMKAGHPLDDDDRRPWLQAIAVEIEHIGDADGRIIIACSALKRSYRDILVHGRADVRIIFLDGSRDLIAKRLRNRKGHFMPPELLDSQFGALEPPQPDEPVIAVPIDAPVEAIVDDIVGRLEAEAGTRVP